MKSLLHLVFTLAILTASGASAADSQASFAAPLTGFVFDPSARSIRPILGVPGAAAFGAPLDLGLSVSSAAISPRQDYALLSGADDLAVVWVFPLAPSGPATPLALAVPAPDRIVFGANGSTVALYRQDSARLQIFTGLPHTPSLAYDIDLSGLPAGLQAAAVSDNGVLALLVAADFTVWISRAGASPVQLDTPPATAIAFQPGGLDAAMAAADGQVWLLQNLSSAMSLRQVAPSDDRLSNPVAVRFDRTGVWVVTSQGTVAALDPQSAKATFASCGCKPTGLNPIQPGRLLRLNEINDGPLMLLDTNTSQPSFWFVPALITDTERSAR